MPIRPEKINRDTYSKVESWFKTRGISQKTLDDLEFFSILKSVEEHCISELGKNLVQNIEPISNSLTTISSESVREIRLLSILLLTSLESFIFPCRIMNNQDSIAPCFIMISSALYLSNSPLEFIRQDFSSSEKCSKKGKPLIKSSLVIQIRLRN